MATQNQPVTKIPTALPGISAGTQYSIQNLGVKPVLVATADDSTPPDADTKSRFRIAPGEFGYPKAGSGETIYIWSASDRQLVAFEASS